MTPAETFEKWMIDAMKVGARGGKNVFIKPTHEEAFLAGRERGLEEAAKLLHMTNAEVRLLAGEMTAGELRAVQAVLSSRHRAIHALKGKP